MRKTSRHGATSVVLMVLLSSIAIRHQFEGAELAGKVIDLAITLAAWFICGILIIAETATPSGDTNSFAEKVRHTVRNTFITKRLVNLFVKNMSAHDENA
jgi:hypothetical protein